MKEIDISELWCMLEPNLINYRELSDTIKIFLIAYENKCRKLISKIKDQTFEDAQVEFDKLHEIQKRISAAVYKYEYKLEGPLVDFLYSFDRDDIYSRRFWYEKFKNGLEWPKE